MYLKPKPRLFVVIWCICVNFHIMYYHEEWTSQDSILESTFDLKWLCFIGTRVKIMDDNTSL
jgi:hypothetical protein